MADSLIRVGEHFVNLAAVAAAHWEREKLFIHLNGGRFVSFTGIDAGLIWDAIIEGSIDLKAYETVQSEADSVEEAE